MATKEDIMALSEQITALGNEQAAGFQQLNDRLDKLTKIVKAVEIAVQKAYDLENDNKKELQRLNRRLANVADRQLRRNLRLSGIPDTINQESLKETILEWFKQNHLQVTDQEVERMHRAFRGRRNQPKEVIITFTQERVRDLVFKTLKKQKDLNFQGTKVFLRHDLSQETLRIKASLQPFAQKIYEAGFRFTWMAPIGILLFKDGNKLTATTPEEAQILLRRLDLLPQEEPEGGQAPLRTSYPRG